MSCACSGIDPNCGNWLTNFISGVWEATDAIAGYSMSCTSGWVLSSANLGKINNLIDTSFSVICLTGISGVITGYNIEPCMGEGEQAIYSKLKEYEFYNQQAKWAMSGIGGSSASTWTNIKEWNRSISRSSKIDIVRQFRELAKDAKEDLQYQVKLYLKYGAIPVSVHGDDDIPGGYFDGGYENYNPRNGPYGEWGAY